MHCTCGEAMCDYCQWKMRRHARAVGRRHFRNVMRHVRRRITNGEMDRISLARAFTGAPVRMVRDRALEKKRDADNTRRGAFQSFLYAAGLLGKTPGSR